MRKTLLPFILVSSFVATSFSMENTSSMSPEDKAYWASDSTAFMSLQNLRQYFVELKKKKLTSTRKVSSADDVMTLAPGFYLSPIIKHLHLDEASVERYLNSKITIAKVTDNDTTPPLTLTTSNEKEEKVEKLIKVRPAMSEMRAVSANTLPKSHKHMEKLIEQRRHSAPEKNAMPGLEEYLRSVGKSKQSNY